MCYGDKWMSTPPLTEALLTEGTPDGRAGWNALPRALSRRAVSSDPVLVKSGVVSVLHACVIEGEWNVHWAQALLIFAGLRIRQVFHVEKTGLLSKVPLPRNTFPF